MNASVAAEEVSRLLERTHSAISEKKSVLYFGKLPFFGTLIERFPNYGIYQSTHYVNGIKDGQTKEFTLAGTLHSFWIYHSGKKDGIQKGWFADGSKRFEFHYKKGVLEGEQLEWHQNGGIFRRQVFLNGVETDKKILYPTAEVFSNYTKRNGRTYGVDGGAVCFERKKEGER